MNEHDQNVPEEISLKENTSDARKQGEISDLNLKKEAEGEIKNNGEIVENIDLGIMQKLAKFWLGENATAMNSIYITMFIKTLMSLSDTISDLSVAIQLFILGKWKWGLAVIAIDYIPMWQVLLHTATSKAWKDLNDWKEKTSTILILLLAPIAFPLFQIRWLINLYKDRLNEKRKNNFLHQNCRLAELISGTLESPLQLLLMMIMYTYNILPSPWSEDYIIEDSVGNKLNVGALPGIMSVSLSSISIITNALDLSEAKSTPEMLSYASFSLTTCIFRMTGYYLAVITFREFSCFMFFLITLRSLTTIVRVKKVSAKEFSLLTTFIVGIFMPSAVSEEPQKSQYSTSDPNDRHQTAIVRRKLTAKIAIGAIPIIMFFNIILLILLTSTGYKLSLDMAMVPEVLKQCIIKVICILVIPSGILAFIGALCIQREKNRTLTTATLVVIAVVTLSLAIGSICQIVSGNIFQ